MQHWNRTKFRCVDTGVQAIRRELLDKQRLMRHALISPDTIAEVKELILQLSNWSVIEETISMIEETIYKQKSWVQWLKQGDSNTTYFFVNTK